MLNYSDVEKRCSPREFIFGHLIKFSKWADTGSFQQTLVYWNWLKMGSYRLSPILFMSTIFLLYCSFVSFILIPFYINFFIYQIGSTNIVNQEMMKYVFYENYAPLNKKYLFHLSFKIELSSIFICIVIFQLMNSIDFHVWTDFLVFTPQGKVMH